MPDDMVGDVILLKGSYNNGLNDDNVHKWFGRPDNTNDSDHGVKNGGLYNDEKINRTSMNEGGKILLEGSYNNDGNDINESSVLMGSGNTSYNSSLGSLDLSITTQSLSQASRQTRQFANCRTSQPMTLVCSVELHSGRNVENVVSRVGVFDDNNGAFFQCNQGNVSVCWRYNNDNTYDIYQKFWNVDRLDGQGPSGLLLKIVDNNNYFIHMANGNIQFGVIDRGVYNVCHIFNRATLPTHFLPFRFELLATYDCTCGTHLVFDACVSLQRSHIKGHLF